MPRRVLILSGPTHEYLDPVRFIGNASSGKMGKAIAETAHAQGFEVEFVTGPVPKENLPCVAHGRIHRVTSAHEMLDAGLRLRGSADVLVFAAAVADFAPAERQTEKIAKTADGMVLRLEATPDIAKTICLDKAPGQIAIGFALQTSDGEANARRKLLEKNLDAIVLNDPGSLGKEDGNFRFLSRGADRFVDWGRIDKQTCAQNILRFVSSCRGDHA